MFCPNCSKLAILNTNRICVRCQGKIFNNISCICDKCADEQKICSACLKKIFVNPDTNKIMNKRGCAACGKK